MSVIAAGYAVVGVGWALLGLAPAVVTVFLAALVITVGEMLHKPTATARVGDLAPEGMQGRFQSLYAGASVGGLLLSPLVGTALYAASPRAVWPAAAAVALLAAAALTRTGRARHQHSDVGSGRGPAARPRPAAPAVPRGSTASP